MSAIFLSHSSSDGAAAARVKAWLEAQGHRSVFLDFDPQGGIPAGRDWERELYQQLRACRAVIVLCSEHSMASRWCFAEITHARSLGKNIFPLKVAECTIDPVLTDLQILDLTAGEEEALARLGRGLAAAGVDAADPLDWDGSRPPYPGLLAFQEDDAAVFFGRDQEVGQALDQLNQMHRYGGASLLLLLGGSGSGKSSLMRAGMVPRLRRAPEQWLVVGPVRPGDDPAANLAAALAHAAGDSARGGGWREIREALAVGGERRDPGEALVERVRDLRLGSGRGEATVVLFIDQLEEMLGHPPDHPGNRFLQQLAAALGKARVPLLAVATLRSDFLATFQKHPALRSLAFRNLSLGPIAPERLREIIEKPAALAGIDLEPALVQALLLDTEAEDALPLLAFTLRELWELSREDRGALGLSDYRDRLGGLQGSVARAAEGVLASRPLSRDEEDSLRGAFLGMVRVGDDGNFARRAIGWEQLSEPAHAWLERFVQARLLVSRGDRGDRTLEVSHEILFRAWERLAAWLDENREALLLLHEMGQAAKLWERGGGADEDLWRGGRLHRALEVRDRAFDRRRSPREGDPGSGGRLPVAPGELDFLAASEAAERRAEGRRRRRRRAVVAASLAVAAFSFGLYLWAAWERRQTAVQGSRVLAQEAYELRDRLDLALLLAVEAATTADTREARTSLLSLIAARPRLETILDQQAGKVHSVTISPRGDLLAAAGDEGVLRVFDLTSGSSRDLARDTRTFALAFSPDGAKLASAGTADGAVRLWDVRAGTLQQTLEGSACPPFARRQGGGDTVFGVAFNPLARTLATTDGWGLVRLWDESTGACLAQEQAHAGAGNAVAFDPTGRLLASAGDDGAVKLWDVTAGLAPGPRLEAAEGTAHAGRATAVAFSPDGRTLASAGSDGRVRLWDLSRSPVPFRELAAADGGDLDAVAFTRDGSLVAAAGASGLVELWDPKTAAHRLRIPAHADTVATLAFDPDRLLATAGTDRSVRLWTTEVGGASGVDVRGDGAVSQIALSPGGGVAATGGDGEVQAWDLTTGEPRLAHPLRVESEATALAVSPDGSLLAAGDRIGDVRLWEVATGRERPLVQLGEDRSYVWWLAFSPDGTRLASGGSGAQVTLRDLGRDTAPVVLRPGPVPPGQTRARALAFGPGGGSLAAGIGPTVRIWDLAGCAELRAGCAGEAVVVAADNPKAEFLSLAFTPDGRTLLAGTGLGEIERWRLEAAGPPRPATHLEGHDGLVLDLLPYPDGRFLASAGGDGKIILWDLENDRAQYDLLGHEASVDALALAAGRLLSASEDGTVRVWQAAGALDLAALRERACRVANRNLTLKEWHQFIGSNLAYRPTCPRRWPGLPVASQER
jgi:WD40 repeat protein